MTAPDPTTSPAAPGNGGVSEAQLAYAGVLTWGKWVAFALLVVAFALYVTGLVPAHVPLDELPQHWDERASTYMEATGVSPGWGWLRLAHTGDYLTFVPIALLALVTIVCYARLVPILARRNDRTYLVICVLEIFVLVLAASGLLVVGH